MRCSQNVCGRFERASYKVQCREVSAVSNVCYWLPCAFQRRRNPTQLGRQDVPGVGRVLPQVMGKKDLAPASHSRRGQSLYGQAELANDMKTGTSRLTRSDPISSTPESNAPEERLSSYHRKDDSSRPAKKWNSPGRESQYPTPVRPFVRCEDVIARRPYR